MAEMSRLPKAQVYERNIGGTDVVHVESIEWIEEPQMTEIVRACIQVRELCEKHGRVLLIQIGPSINIRREESDGNDSE